MQSQIAGSAASEVAASLAARRVGMLGLTPRLEKRVAHILSTAGAESKSLGEESSFQDWRDCDVLIFEMAPRNADLAPRLLVSRVPVLAIGSWADVLNGTAGASEWAAGFLVENWPDEQLLAAILVIRSAAFRRRKAPARRPVPLALIADDDEAVSDLLEPILAKLGLACQVARDGPSALAMIRNLRPDVVLLDVNMPGLNGFEVLTRVRRDPRLDNVAVALLTACDDDAHVRQASRLSVDDYIVKPIQPGLFPARIQRLLALTASAGRADDDNEEAASTASRPGVRG